ncbi:MAG: O-methyltransferase [Acidobacteriota bacterium]|nr:O-methyltransferase [Acidobacteriota bacterium]
MSEEDLWSTVDGYVAERLIGTDPDLEAALEDSARAGLPAIAVSAPQGKLLHLIARSISARRVLEVGTLGGYSTIWLARALPDDGTLVTLEIEPRHAEVARANLDRAGVGRLVEIRVGPAMESLSTLAQQPADPFDLVFIDADKEHIPAYFDLAVGITRPGGVIITDNVVRGGALADATVADGRVRGVRAFHDLLAARSDVEATTIQTVGSKGYDGFTLAVLNAR